MYKTDMEEFKRKAAEWTNTFAKEETQDDKVQKILEMGYTEDQAKEALEKYNYSVELALNFLLGGS